MTRKVVLAKKTADEIVALQQEADQRGIRTPFRHAWIAIWKALHQRPLPPDESDAVFGEIRYRTKHAPKHAVCVASMRPLSVRFSICEENVILAGESVTLVTILKVILMS